MKKDRHLFHDKEKGVLGFVLPYLDPNMRDWLKVNPVTINYFEHDWTLNGLVQADR